LWNAFLVPWYPQEGLLLFPFATFYPITRAGKGSVCIWCMRKRTYVRSIASSSLIVDAILYALSRWLSLQWK
jgi:hypothetical protein